MISKVKILITGANGYIGNCLFHFLKKKFNIIGVDCENNINRDIHKINLLNTRKLDNLLYKIKPQVVIHLAAQSLVDETINKNKYYNNNVLATRNLVNLMKKNNIKNIIFSSTASVYKKNKKPLSEKSKVEPLSYYAKTKFFCENDIKYTKGLSYIILRFFNVCSALSNPLVGELHKPETHLIPTVVYKSLKRKKIFIYGENFDTHDGTCIRDYIHIKDICLAIEKSIKYLIQNKNSLLLNVGNSKGYSNKEILNFVKNKIKKPIKVSFKKKKRGDVPSLLCNYKKAKLFLSWKPTNSNLHKIIKDEITWIKKIDKMGIKRKFKNYIK